MIEKAFILLAFTIVAIVIFFLGYITGDEHQSLKYDKHLSDIRDECVKEIMEDLDRVEKLKEDLESRDGEE